MKTKIINFIALMSLTFSSYSQLKVFSSGGISIGGTSSIPYPFIMQVAGNSVFSANQNTISSAAMIRGLNAWSSATTPDFTWFNNDQTGLFHPASNIIGFTIGGSEKMRLNSSGRLLVGTTTDNGIISTNSSDYRAASFSVTLSSDWAAASMTTYNNKGNSGNYEVNLAGTGTTFYVAGAGWIYSQGNYLGSDRNIKDDIRKIENASDKILKLNGVLYKLKKEKQHPELFPKASEYMGVIAQEVEEVAPQAVKTMQDGTKAVCYEMLVGLLIEGYKEQNAKIKELENELNQCCNIKDNSTIMNSNGLFGGNSNSVFNNGKSCIKQNSPNPFTKETVIEYSIIEKDAYSSILIFDMNGKLLKTLAINKSGNGSVIISGNDFQPGMYYYSLIINNKEIDTKKMILTQ